MTTFEPENKDIIYELNELALRANWGTVDRIEGKPKAAVIIQKAIEEIQHLRKLTEGKKERNILWLPMSTGSMT